MKVRTIKGYKSAIVGLNVGTFPHICRLISSFYRDTPLEPNLVPCWDLTVVLDKFTKSPFEPRDMASVELKFLTFKTVFLLSLACRARRGEIHTLDQSCIRWSPDGKDVFLRPYMGFMAKPLWLIIPQLL